MRSLSRGGVNNDNTPDKSAAPDTADPETPERTQTTPAELFGVGGTTAMVSILTNDILTDDQKINIMMEWFGLEKEVVTNMLNNANETTE